AGRTLVSVDSRSPDFRSRAKSGGNVAAAKIVGELVAQKAKANGIGQVVFDRGGYQYHGRVKALAEAAPAGGLAFLCGKAVSIAKEDTAETTGETEWLRRRSTRARWT